MLLSFGTVGIGYLYISELRKPLYISPIIDLLPRHANATAQREVSRYMLEKALHEKRIIFETIEPISGGFSVKTHDGSEIVFSSKKDVALQISSLQFILSRLTMESKLFSRLDLRFDKPVIVLQ